MHSIRHMMLQGSGQLIWAAATFQVSVAPAQSQSYQPALGTAGWALPHVAGKMAGKQKLVHDSVLELVTAHTADCLPQGACTWQMT